MTSPSIEVTAFNRPIKIVYIIPIDDPDKSNLVLDAVFVDSYSRWAGSRTLLIPIENGNSIDKCYEAWLHFFDPDYIYSYVDLPDQLIKRIDHLSCPVLIRKFSYEGSEPKTWQGYLPTIQENVSPVPSISTINTPACTIELDRHNRDFTTNSISAVLTQSRNILNERFISDNFGFRHDTHQETGPQEGNFNIVNFIPEGTSYSGNPQIRNESSVNQIFLEIAHKKILTFARLSMVYADSIPTPHSTEWSNHFNIIVGTSVMDRINFWNARHFSPHYIQCPGSLIIDPQKFSDNGFVENLNKFLRLNNTIYRGQSTSSTLLRSCSLDKLVLEDYSGLLTAGQSNNYVSVPTSYSAPATPDENDLRKRTANRDFYSFKVSDTENLIEARDPYHFRFNQPFFDKNNQGQWAIDLVIQRDIHNKLYTNIKQIWQFTRKSKIVKSFVQSYGKVTTDNLLTIVPDLPDFMPAHSNVREKLSYKLTIPSDTDVIEYSTLQLFPYHPGDLRFGIASNKYSMLEISDKGKRLRGIVSMFESVAQASDILTNRFWRTILRSMGKDRTKTLNELKGYLPDDGEEKKIIQKRLNLENPGQVREHYNAGLKDTLKYFVKNKTVFQLHQWSCSYCGFKNSLSVNEVNSVNTCSICQEEYQCPVDISWTFKFNKFILQSLIEHNGLTVLWAIGYLNNLSRNSFYYLPEVNLYENFSISKREESSTEIDILCVVGGTFYAGEVKLSAAQFTDDQGKIDKFINCINKLDPDVALLVFEQYCGSESDINLYRDKLKEVCRKIRRDLHHYIKLEIIIAADKEGFITFPNELGIYGDETSKFYGFKT